MPAGSNSLSFALFEAVSISPTSRMVSLCIGCGSAICFFQPLLLVFMVSKNKFIVISIVFPLQEGGLSLLKLQSFFFGYRSLILMCSLSSLWVYPILSRHSLLTIYLCLLPSLGSFQSLFKDFFCPTLFFLSF